MTGSATKHGNGSTSFALGLLLAALTVLLSHVVFYVLVAAAFDNFVLEPLFSPTLFAGVMFIVLAGVLYRAVLSSRRKHDLPLNVSIGKSFVWTLVLALAFSVMYALIYVATEIGDIGMLVVLFSFAHAIPALLLAIVTGAIGINLHRKAFEGEPVPSQLD